SDPFHPGRWEVPGGRLEVEDDLDLDHHIRREIWEEGGLKIEPGPPFHLWQWFMPDRAAPPRGARIRGVAAARRCRPVTGAGGRESQDSGDHLDGCASVALERAGSSALVAGWRPVVRPVLAST